MMTAADVLRVLRALGVYPAAGFVGTGVVDGQPVRCLTAEVQVLCHAGYQLREVDLHDMLIADYGHSSTLVQEHT